MLRDPQAQRLFVVVAAEGRAFPDLASTTWEEGAGHVRTRLRTYLDEQIALKRMAIQDPDFAVEQLLGVLVGPLISRIHFGRPSYFEKHAAAYIEAAVDLFLDAYLTTAGHRALR